MRCAQVASVDTGPSSWDAMPMWNMLNNPRQQDEASTFQQASAPQELRSAHQDYVNKLADEVNQVYRDMQVDGQCQ